MMILFLSLLVLACGVVGLLFFKNVRLKRETEKIAQELNRQILAGERETIQFFSSEKSIQQLLVQLNRILEDYREVQLREIRSNESSKKMLANISHDLKTPLTVISGYSEILLADQRINEDEELKLRIERIQKQTNNVLNTISEFFDLAKLEAEELALRQDPVNLGELCKEVLLTYFEWIEAEKMEMVVEIPDTEILIVGDAEALRRVLSNLLSNAVKYGGAGKYLAVKMETKANDVVITVTDHGPGILEENYEKIFERLYTQNDSRNKRYQGSGLGLTITKHLTEAMKGKVSVYSKPYERTTFTLEFPVYK